MAKLYCTEIDPEDGSGVAARVTGNDVMVELSDMNEGYYGEYDRYNDEDERLLHLTVFTKEENGWEPATDTQTQIRADVDRKKLKRLVKVLWASYWSILDFAPHQLSLREIDERMSTVSDNDF